MRSKKFKKDNNFQETKKSENHRNKLNYQKRAQKKIKNQIKKKWRLRWKSMNRKGKK